MTMNQSIITDHNGFAQKHLPDLDEEVEDFTVYTWKLTNWKDLDKRITSPEFRCGGHSWRLLLFPSGNSVPTGAWHVCVQFAIAIANPTDPSAYAVSDARHRFTPDESDWGFTRFAKAEELYSVQSGSTKAIVQNEATDVIVYMRAIKDVTGVLWRHDWRNYDSKKETGYVGLKNQGATGYINAHLQTRFCINAFRKIIHQIPTQNDPSLTKPSSALQNTFIDMQTSDKTVSTTKLTQSFGWKPLDSFLQHDVVEFARVLDDKLIQHASGTAAETAMETLFSGQMKSYIKCVHVNYEASRTETFHDLQLEVESMKSLRDSLCEYIAVDNLDGDNKFVAGNYGPQIAVKGIIFSSLPPVLHIQLKRFKYDYVQDRMVKVNTRHEYPADIDLQEFLDGAADRSKSWVYKLHGVIVHDGNLSGGQYITFFKSTRDGKWLKFDDDRVTFATDREVFDCNYGARENSEARAAHAYVLIYIREAMINRVLAPVTESDVPPYQRERFIKEQQQLAELRLKPQQSNFITIKIVDDASFRRHQGFDLGEYSNSPVPTLRVPRTETFASFKSRVSQAFGYAESQFHLRIQIHRQNKTIRPDTMIPEDQLPLNLEAIRTRFAASGSELVLYLDVIQEESKPALDTSGAILIFLKHFDVRKQTLLGMGKKYVRRNSRPADLRSIINEEMKWPPSTSLRFYEEIKPGMIERMNANDTFSLSDIQDGDIICVQVEMTREEIKEIEDSGLHVDPPKFYKSLEASNNGAVQRP